MKCECLFCERQATSLLTVPMHKPKTFICEEHLEEQMAWAAKWRAFPGSVVVERLSQ